MPRLAWPCVNAWIVTTGVTLLAGASLAVVLADRWWGFSLLASFSLQFICLGFLLVILALLQGFKWLALIAALFGGMQLPAAGILFYEQHPPTTLRPFAAVTLRLVTLNLQASNQNYAGVIAYLHRECADIVILQEVRGRWPQQLAGLADLYPFAAPTNLPVSEDVLVLSRHPIMRAERIRSSPEVLLFRVEIELAGRRLLLFPVHLESPKSAAAVAQRASQLDGLRRLAAATDEPMIVAGDFNVVRWNPELNDFLTGAGLADAADGRGWIPTWPTFFPLLAVPIDRIVTNRRFEVTHIERGPHVGSDHWPLVVQLRCCTLPTEAPGNPPSIFAEEPIRRARW